MTSVAVIGGGLAGITAALRCRDAGAEVTLYEGRPKLGGLTHSFRRGDLDVDNGQHVFLRCCTAYQDLLVRLGVADQVTLQDRLDIPVRAPGLTRKARLRRNGLPAPMHLGASLLRYPLLDTAQRLRFVRAALAMRRLDRTDPAVDARSFGDWLAEHKQDRATIDAMWDLVGIATLNAAADQASLALAAMVFQVGLLTDPGAADIGWASVPLQRLHGDAAVRALEINGATVCVGAKVDVVEPRERRWLVGAKGGEQLVDAVVMAVPPAATERLAPAGSVALEPGYAAKLGTSPIVNVHVVVDRHVLDTPFVAGVGTPIQWVFDRTVQSGLGDWAARRPVPRRLGVGGRRFHRPAGGDAARTVAARPRRAAARDGARRNRRLLRHARTRSDVSPGARQRRTPATRNDAGTRALPGRRVDRHRLAGDDGGRGPQWRRRGGGPALAGRTGTGRINASSSRTTGGGGMTAMLTALHRSRDQIVPALQAAVQRLDPSSRLQASYHLGWCDADGKPTEGGGGKAVRPALALLSAEAAGATAEVGVPGAVGVELVHNFSLLHDDLMDGDLERRHRRTVWAIWGAPAAILAGDALLALAHEVVLESPSPHAGRAALLLATTTRELTRGQVQDVAFESRSDVTLDECLDMAGGKTGALLAASAAIGAVLAGAPEDVVDALTTFGGEVGLAFQLVDDVLGIWGDPVGHRQAGLQRPAVAQEVAAGHVRAGQRRPWRRTEGMARRTRSARRRSRAARRRPRGVGRWARLGAGRGPPADAAGRRGTDQRRHQPAGAGRHVRARAVHRG